MLAERLMLLAAVPTADPSLVAPMVRAAVMPTLPALLETSKTVMSPV
jgi:hypothetical protein